ncbi:MAG: Bax inhibitor-1/YccA family protein [Flavobacteriales bacterium]|nr:Bax inhibitor-1/YccA family protein [Flavobacteriales bacterium]
MSLFKSSNPVLGDRILDKDYVTVREETMTVDGAINKTLIFLAILMAAASIGYSLVLSGQFPLSLMYGGIFVAIGLAFFAYYKPKYVMYIGSAYCAIEGIVVGGLSAFYSILYPGIIVQALVLTSAVLAAMLFLYKAKIITVTQKFRSIIIMATAGIAIFYFIALIMGMFGISIPLLHSNGPIGIGFSLVVTALAALNLLLDFDFIEKGTEKGLPKYMEWYGAFGLIVTLIWLYLEILRLLSKLRD